MMAVSRVVTGSVDTQLLFSVVLGLIGLALDFPDMFEAGKLGFKLFKEYRSFCQEMDMIGNDNSNSRENLQLESACLEQEWKCKWIFLRYSFYTFVYLVLLLFTLAKLAGFFLCDSHLVNGNGCAK